MLTENERPDDLVAFQDVRVIRSTAPALLCWIAGKTVWLPRGHIAGKLWCTGDRGKLFVRRWVARDRHLIDLRDAPTVQAPAQTPAAAAQLYLVREDRK